MKIFINDKPVNILKAEEIVNPSAYEVVVNGPETDIAAIKLEDDVLIKDASASQIDAVMNFMKRRKLKKLESVTFTVNDHTSVKHFIKSRFNIIKAAGGVVQKDDKVLLIYRLKKWDLPKGKLDPGETVAEGALREVEEECNVKVKLGNKICSTWHTYTRNRKRILKKTTWYAMQCLEDENMKPQQEESIEEVRWMNAREVRQAMYNSYPSIRQVFQAYYKIHAIEH